MSWSVRPPLAHVIAGFVAAAVALGAGELIAAAVGARPPVVVVADWVVDLLPGSLLRFGETTFGTNDKPALVWTVVLVALALGALLGPLAARVSWAGGAIFTAFGFVGWLAEQRDVTVSTLDAFFAGAGGAFAGYLALKWLLRLAAEERGTPREAVAMPGRGVADRRRFLAFAGTATAGAAVAAVIGRSLDTGADVEAQRAEVAIPTVDPARMPAGLDVPGVTALVVPNDRFYRIDTALAVPRVDSSKWRLRVKGMVEQPFELSFEELMALPAVEESITLCCVSNEVGGDLVGNAVWRGVPLADLLRRAGVRPGATQVVGRSVDGFTVGFPTEVALDGRTAMVAYGMNGEALPAAHGFPARLVVPGLYGYVSATKWLSEIELTTLETFDAYWVPRGWSKQAPIKTQSRIDTPRKNATAGRVPVAGVAWGGIRGIKQVDVRITRAGDSSGTWHRARLGEALSSSSWRQWVVEDWTPEPGEYRLEVQATDGEGTPQTEARHEPAPNGATGLHTVTVRVRAA
ncbi:MAG: molybdopterin-dependent oxidoreductase [Dehalococcoidia bacterium]